MSLSLPLFASVSGGASFRLSVFRRFGLRWGALVSGLSVLRPSGRFRFRRAARVSVFSRRRGRVSRLRRPVLSPRPCPCPSGSVGGFVSCRGVSPPSVAGLVWLCGSLVSPRPPLPRSVVVPLSALRLPPRPSPPARFLPSRRPSVSRFAFSSVAPSAVGRRASWRLSFRAVFGSASLVAVSALSARRVVCACGRRLRRPVSGAFRLPCGCVVSAFSSLRGAGPAVSLRRGCVSGVVPVPARGRRGVSGVRAFPSAVSFRLSPRVSLALSPCALGGVR